MKSTGNDGPRLGLLVAILLIATGCNSVPADVVESVGVLRDNTHKLAANYSELLERAPAPAAEGETDAEKDASAAAWERHRKHELMLMSVNNTLADKVYEWAEVSKEDMTTTEEAPSD